MINPPKLVAPMYVEPSSIGFCTLISNINQMGYFHSHDYYEAFLVTDGSAVHYVNGKEFDLNKGSLVFLRPDDQHCYLQPSVNFQFINVIITDSVVLQLISYLGDGFPEDIILHHPYPSQRDLPTTGYEPLLSRMNQLIIFPKISAAQYNTTFRIAVADILSHFINEHLFSEISSYPHWLRKLIAEMYKPENYVRGTEAIYKMANCTQEHLCRTFRKYLDMTPSQYINQIRLEEAARSIIYTDTPILNISEEVGFDSLSHFYHLFKEQFHMSPRSYRKYSRQSPSLK